MKSMYDLFVFLGVCLYNEETYVLLLSGMQLADKINFKPEFTPDKMLSCNLI